MTISRMTKRKLQVSNGHYLEFDQLARILNTFLSVDDSQKVSMSFLEEETGLPFRQVRNRISIGRAMGIFEERAMRLTDFGKLVAAHDPFFEMTVTLEYVHYLSAGSFRNLVWYEAFNTLLPSQPPLNHEGWLQYFRLSLANNYTEHSIKDHVGKEVRFIIDAYTTKEFSKLELFYKDSEERIHRRRYTEFNNNSLASIIYDYAFKNNTKLLQINDLIDTSGSPGVLFAVDESTFRKLAEDLHELGWLRYERTHNLDQIRLLEGYNALNFLRACYEQREPVRA